MRHELIIDNNLKMPLRILYASDMHSSSTHMASFLAIASKENVDLVIVNGDICPKIIFMEYSGLNLILRKQEAYLRETLLLLLKEFKAKNPTKTVLLDLANDDFKFNRYVLERQEGYLLNLLHMKTYEILPNLTLVGYMNVPITPFGIKDWEKPDKQGYYRAESRLSGCRSVNGAIKEDYVINVNSEDTVENDLRFLSEKVKTPFIFVCHTPPVNTHLDSTAWGNVGSTAVREFIESRQDIVVSLHGHIHESPRVTGKIKDTIGKVPCINVGQSDKELDYLLLTIT